MTVLFAFILAGCAPTPPTAQDTIVPGDTGVPLPGPLPNAVLLDDGDCPPDSCMILI